MFPGQTRGEVARANGIRRESRRGRFDLVRGVVVCPFRRGRKVQLSGLSLTRMLEIGGGSMCVCELAFSRFAGSTEGY